MLKKVPSARFELLFPPVAESADFAYFRDAEMHPFQHAAAAFAPVNAWWLAEASLRAYSSAATAVAVLRRAGLTAVGDQLLQHGQPQCYAAFNDDFVIVAFRGTEMLRADL